MFEKYCFTDILESREMEYQMVNCYMGCVREMTGTSVCDASKEMIMGNFRVTSLNSSYFDFYVSFFPRNIFEVL